MPAVRTVAWGPEDAFEGMWLVAGRALGLGSVLFLVRGQKSPPRPLPESEVRRKILLMLEEHPAIPLAEIRERVPVGWGTVWYHIQKLAKADLIRIIPSGKRKIVVRVNSAPTAVEVRALAVLRGSTARKISRYIQRNPESSVSAISEALGLSTRVAYYHVKVLLEVGLLSSSSPTRHFGLRATPLLDVLFQEK